MTSTIKVNTIQNACGADIIKESSNTITIGASGDTVTLASGASQSGFGRSGSVNWQTTKKTANFDATSGEGYFVDTAASGAVTMTLPASPSAGDIVAVKDYNQNFANANLTIGRNGSPINGASSADATIDTAGASLVLVYVDASQGWIPTQDDSSDVAGSQFLIATGGTVTTSGNDKIHTFTAPGTFCVSQASACASDNVVSYIVVAAGAGGGATASGSFAAGGGGAGGYREVKSPVTPYTASPLDGYSTPGNRITVTATSFPITVGGGGAAGPTSSGTVKGTSGGNSSFSTITSAGGGGGGAGANPATPGADGGSGGGAGGFSPGSGTGGAGNTPPVSPPQGNAGGASGPGDAPGASGGGATGVGVNGSPGTGTPKTGGTGATSSITGSPVTRSVGGASGNYSGSPGNTGSNGGDNTGTGGQGGGGMAASSGNGGSGVVIIRYKFQ